MTNQPQSQDPLIGRVLDGRYEMLERIGEGGMGVVYKGRQVSIDRIVAIKMLSQQLAKDPNWVARFNREAKACSRLQHPNTIRMFDFGQTREGRLFMAMEFLKGQSLRETIDTQAPLAPERVLKILIQCCASLAEAHNIGIIHRDIKPDNVFLLNLAGSPDFVKLLDFSVAKLLQENEGMRTQAGMVFGTPQYMSPEQGRGQQLDARSDLYALGILAFEMLTGRVPFTDANPMNVLAMHSRQPVPPLPDTLPPVMKQLVLRMLEKDPARRHQSATELMQDCQQAFSGLGGSNPGIAAVAPAPAAPPGLGPTPPAGGGAAEQKTMIATDSPLASAAPPPASAPPAAGAPPPVAAAAEQKTMIAGESPLAHMPPVASVAAAEQKTMIATESPIARMASQNAAAEQKTMIATESPVAGGIPGLPGPMIIDHNAPPQTDSPKTMLLPDSEGLVSIADQGASGPTAAPNSAPIAAPAAVYDVGDTSAATEIPTGATPLFWVICLLTGLGVGVLAYIVVLQLGN